MKKLYSPIPQEELFLEMLRIVKEEQIPLAKTKGQDYCGPSVDQDALENVAACLGWVGAIKELDDKLRRLWSFLQSGNLHHESVEDSLTDIINFALYAKILYRKRTVDTQIIHREMSND